MNYVDNFLIAHDVLLNDNKKEDTNDITIQYIYITDNESDSDDDNMYFLSKNDWNRML